MKKNLKMGFRNTFFSSHKSGNKRGVAILIPNSISFELISEIKEKDSRFVVNLNIRRSPNLIYHIPYHQYTIYLDQDFTFYSPRHNIHSRIDYFLMFNNDRHRIRH